MHLMAIKLLRFITLALCCYPLTLLAADERSKSIPEDCTTRMEQSSVIEIAKRAALSKGVELERYDLRDLSFEFLNHRWTVSFDEKSLSFDGCFHIFVDDDTGSSEFRACP